MVFYITTMRKFIFLLAAAAVWFATPGCSNNDDLWNAIEDLENAVQKNNSDLEALQALVEAMQKSVTIDSVTPLTDGGYVINFSDGRSVTISDGKDGDSFFASVEDGDDSVTFTMSDGTVLTLAKSGAFSFVIIRDGDGIELFNEQHIKSFDVESSGVADWFISCPNGWQAVFDGETLTVTAPDESNAYAVEQGEIAIMVTAVSGATKIVKMSVSTFEMRVLTFEDEDYKGANGAGYWTSMIDREYGGPLLYGDYDYCDYQWCDDGNTMLTSGLVEVYDMRVFWNGGHAVSNYLLTDRSKGNYTTQLSVYSTDANAVAGGHNGSENFCVHFGYVDNFSYSSTLPELKFVDGKERVIDHMYVMITAYTAHSLLDGDGFTKAAGDDDWFGIVAAGFDAKGNETGRVSMNIFEPGRKMIQDWTKFDLSPLGKVATVKFSCAGSMTSPYGLDTPAYFAYDDVAVRF